MTQITTNVLGGIMQKELVPWLHRVKDESFRKVSCSPLTRGCAEGRAASLSALLIGFWPFVDKFPGIIKSKYEGSRDLKAKLLAEMEGDERGHRTLWIQSCEELKITQETLSAQETLPRVQRLIDYIGEDLPSYRSFLRFLAVEIVAEGLSVGLVRHAAFQEALGERGLQWFNVHLNAQNEALETSHEMLTIRLAKRDAGDAADDEGFANEVTQAVDRFIEAGEDCHSHLALATR